MGIYIVCDGCSKDLGQTIKAEADMDGLLLCPDCRKLSKSRDTIGEIKEIVLCILEDSQPFLGEKDRGRLLNLDKTLTKAVNIIETHLGLLPF